MKNSSTRKWAFLLIGFHALTATGCKLSMGLPGYKIDSDNAKETESAPSPTPPTSARGNESGGLGSRGGNSASGKPSPKSTEKADPKREFEATDFLEIRQYLLNEVEKETKKTDDDIRKDLATYASSKETGLDLGPSEADEFVNHAMTLKSPGKFVILHHAVFHLAYLDPKGLKIAEKDEARAMAERLTQEDQAEEKLGILLSAYYYASDANGIALNPADAHRFAEKLAQKSNGYYLLDTHIETFKRYYSDLNGPQKSAEEAWKITNSTLQLE